MVKILACYKDSNSEEDGSSFGSNETSYTANLNLKAIALAAEEIKNGNLVAFPTETVYGIGANAYMDSAVAKIFNIKRRPTNNPLIVHFKDASSIEEECIIGEHFHLLAKAFMPGPLTLILKKKMNSRLSKLCCNNLDVQAVRVPNSLIALDLLKTANVPIAAPSANISNKISPTTADHVASSFFLENLLVLDGGQTILGLESTVLDVSNPKNIAILRHGTITEEDLLQVGIIFSKTYEMQQNKVVAPGSFKKHYSPNTELSLDVNSLKAGDVLIAFGKVAFLLPEDVVVLNLSEKANLKEAARNLYKVLWEADSLNKNKIVVMPIPNLGIGVAINERLKKASARS